MDSNELFWRSLPAPVFCDSVNPAAGNVRNQPSLRPAGHQLLFGLITRCLRGVFGSSFSYFFTALFLTFPSFLSPSKDSWFISFPFFESFKLVNCFPGLNYVQKVGSAEEKVPAGPRRGVVQRCGGGDHADVGCLGEGCGSPAQSSRARSRDTPMFSLVLFRLLEINPSQKKKEEVLDLGLLFLPAINSSHDINAANVTIYWASTWLQTQL